MRKKCQADCFFPFSDASDEKEVHGKANKRKFVLRFSLEKTERKHSTYSNSVAMFSNFIHFCKNQTVKKVSDFTLVSQNIFEKKPLKQYKQFILKKE